MRRNKVIGRFPRGDQLPQPVLGGMDLVIAGARGLGLTDVDRQQLHQLRAQKGGYHVTQKTVSRTRETGRHFFQQSQNATAGRRIEPQLDRPLPPLAAIGAEPAFLSGLATKAVLHQRATLARHSISSAMKASNSSRCARRGPCPGGTAWGRRWVAHGLPRSVQVGQWQVSPGSGFI